MRRRIYIKQVQIKTPSHLEDKKISAGNKKKKREKNTTVLLQTSKHLSVRAAAASSASCFSQQQLGGAASAGKTAQKHDARVEMVKTEEHVETFWVEEEASGQPEPGSVPRC